jgi:hypothetical protein
MAPNIDASRRKAMRASTGARHAQAQTQMAKHRFLRRGTKQGIPGLQLRDAVPRNG